MTLSIEVSSPIGDDYATSVTLAKSIISHWYKKGFWGIRSYVLQVEDGSFVVRSNIGPKGYPPRT